MRPDVADLLILGAHYEDILRISLRQRHPDQSQTELTNMIQDMSIVFEVPKYERTVEITTGQWVRMHSYRTADGGTVLLRTDFTELVNTQKQLKIDAEKLRTLVYCDPLTGSPNRKNVSKP